MNISGLFYFYPSSEPVKTLPSIILRVIFEDGFLSSREG